jgi:hypothetical protein
MSRDELAQLSPRHLATDIPAGPEDVRVTVDLAKSGHVRSVLVGGLPANARAILDKAWGNAVEGADGPEWFNPERGWRAVYMDSLQTVQLTGYIPATKILGGGPGIALFTKPLLGATRDQISAAYPMTRVDGKKLVIELPPSEGGAGKVTLSHFDGTSQRAKRLTMEVPYDTEARRDELLKLMTAKWGTPTPKAAVLVFPTDKVKIEVTDGAKRLAVAIALP